MYHTWSTSFFNLCTLMIWSLLLQMLIRFYLQSAVDPHSQQQLLQYDINSLFKWSTEWKLYFNQAKCVHIVFKPHTIFHYHLNDIIINQVEVQRDLVLIISGDLTWSHHYKFITAKAYKILGLLCHKFASSHNVSVKLNLYSYCSGMFQAVILFSNMVTLRHCMYWKNNILGDYTSGYKSILISLKLLPLMYFFEL